MVSFKKNGRPTKAEKGLLKNINNLLSSFTDEDKGRYDFTDEKVTEGGRLNEIWDILQGGSSDEPSKESSDADVSQEDEVTIVGDNKVNTSTGEVLEEEETQEEENNTEENTKETQEEVKFVKQEKEMKDAEEATILDEIENESGGDANEIPTSFNPLSDPIKERSYNKKQSTTVGDIEEPDFGSQPSASEEINAIDEEQAAAEEEAVYEEEEQASAFDGVTNEAMNDLDPKDKKEAAKQLVQTVLDAYEMLHDVGQRYVQYPEEKIQEKIIKEEIDPTMAIPIDELGNTTNVTEFFKEFNEQAAEAISYDPAFGEKVRPAMERVFSKKGWGMTDEQFLLVAFGKDIGWKGMQIMNLKKTANGIMDTFVQLQREKFESQAQAHPAQSVAPDSIVTPPPPPAQEAAEPIYQHEHEQEEEEYDNSSDVTDVAIVQD
jgi:hypothetical protein